MTDYDIVLEAESQGCHVLGTQNPNNKNLWIVPPVKLKHVPTGEETIVALVQKWNHRRQLPIKALAKIGSQEFDVWRWVPIDELGVQVFELS